MKFCTFIGGLGQRYQTWKDRCNFFLNVHLIIHNDWNITSYKTVTIATRTLARISLIILHFIAFKVFGIIQIFVAMVTMKNMYFYWIFMNS